MDDAYLEQLADRFLATASNIRKHLPAGWESREARLLVVGAMRFALTRGRNDR